MVTAKKVAAKKSVVSKEPKLDKGGMTPEQAAAATAAVATLQHAPADDVFMEHADGRKAEVHRNSVETMEGLGWKKVK